MSSAIPRGQVVDGFRTLSAQAVKLWRALSALEDKVVPHSALLVLLNLSLLNRLSALKGGGLRGLFSPRFEGKLEPFYLSEQRQSQLRDTS